MRILVLGYVVRGPLGGLAWHHLQYVLGLKRLGHEVYFLEDSDDFDSCYDPFAQQMTANPSVGLAFAQTAFARLGLDDCWAYYDAHTRTWCGPCAVKARDLCETADVCLNISGVNPLRDWFAQVPVRALIDTDPAFTQIRHLTDAAAMENAKRHNAFFSFGENIGQPGCSIPLDGLAWQATRQPVVLDVWPVTPGPRDGGFSTIMQWDSYPAQQYEGRTYGMKSMSFAPFANLPKKTHAILEVALGSASAPRDALRKLGWVVHDPFEASRDPWVYQQFIRQSRAEFTVAKHGYVASASGWFSERSAAYLASGRPVVTQDTGFATWLSAKRGVISFHSPDEAVAAIRSVCDDYEMHCRAARDVAEQYFDARLVLPALLAGAIDIARPEPACTGARSK